MTGPAIRASDKNAAFIAIPFKIFDVLSGGAVLMQVKSGAMRLSATKAIFQH